MGAGFWKKSSPKQGNDEAFTLTEMAASLVVAAMLVAGLGEVTRQFARTTVRVRATLEETRDARVVQAEFARLEQAEPGSVRVDGDSLAAMVGEGEVQYALRASAGSGPLLEIQRSDGPARSAPVHSLAQFAMGQDGAVRLLLSGEPPLLIARPRRTAPYNCRFDVVVRDCR